MTSARRETDTGDVTNPSFSSACFVITSSYQLVEHETADLLHSTTIWYNRHIPNKYLLIQSFSTLLRPNHTITMFSSVACRSLSRRAVGGSSWLSSSLQTANFHASTVCLEKLNVEGLAKKVDLAGKNVLVRVDLNVPLAKVRTNAGG
jgi:hypothetical protein